jgi:hypothetical protein
MSDPGERREEEHNEDNHALFGGRQSENAEEPFHLLT